MDHDSTLIITPLTPLTLRGAPRGREAVGSRQETVVSGQKTLRKFKCQNPNDKQSSNAKVQMISGHKESVVRRQETGNSSQQSEVRSQ